MSAKKKKPEKASAALGDGSDPVPPVAPAQEPADGAALPADQPALLPADDAEVRSRLSFFGRSGHLAVMSELLHRRINVAIPEVDVGDDVFVVRGTDETVTRVQVKSATALEQAQSYVGRFKVPEAQLSMPNDSPPLVYVFALRRNGRWSEFVVIRRSALFARRTEGAGYRQVDENGKVAIEFRIAFTNATAICGPGEIADFHAHRDAWDPWPPPYQKEGDDPGGEDVPLGG